MPDSLRPPTPEELREISKLFFKQQTEGVSRTLVEAGRHPIDVTYGASFGTLKDLAKALWSGAANVGQALTPAEWGGVPGATDAPIPAPRSLGEVLPNTAQRLQRIGNSVLFGLPDVLQQRVNNSYPQEIRTVTPQDHLAAWTKGLGKTVLMDVLPGTEASQMWSGVGPDGKPLTATEAGKLGMMGLIKTATIGGLRGYSRKFDPPSPLDSTLRATRSVGERQAAQERLGASVIDDEAAGAVVDANAKPTTPPATPPPVLRPGLSPTDLPPNVANHFELVKQGVFDAPETVRLVNEAVQTQAWTDAAQRLGPNVMKTQVHAAAIREGALSGDTLTRLSRDYGIPLDEVAATTADVLERTASLHGSGLEPFNRGAKLAFEELAEKAVRGDKDAIRQMQRMKLLKERTETEGGLWQQLHNGLRKAEGVRLSAMVSQPATAARNAIAQGATFAVNVFEDAVMNTYEALLNKPFEGKPLREYFGDTLNDLTAMVHRFSPEQRASLNELLHNVPLVELKLTGASTWEIGGDVLTAATKGIWPESKSGYVDLARDTMNILNRTQEMEFRRLFFESRLKSNIERIGLKDFKEVMTELGKPAMREDLRFALADATEHALKQTYAFRPEGGFWGGLLDVYKKASPVATMVAFPFPRFLANQYRFMMERSPSMWFDMFSPDFRNALMQGAEGGFRSKAAARQLAKATSGALMMGMAYGIQSDPELVGPKYYLMKTDEKDQNGATKYWDVRPYQPFSTFMFLGHLLNKAATGDHAWTLDPNETMEATVGARSVNEIALFAIPDAFRSVKADDPTPWIDIVQKPMGRYLSGFFVPFKALMEMYGGGAAIVNKPSQPVPSSVFSGQTITAPDPLGPLPGSQEALTLRNTEGQEIIGPAMSYLPGAAQSLPPRIDPTTGKPITTEPADALWRQFTGVSKQPMNKFAELLKSTPDIQLETVIGKHATPEAKDLVRTSMGTMLSFPVGKSTFGDILGNEILKANLSPNLQRMVVQGLLTKLREDATAMATVSNPVAFIEDKLSQYPSFIAGLVRGPVKSALTNQPPQQVP